MLRVYELKVKTRFYLSQNEALAQTPSLVAHLQLNTLVPTLKLVSAVGPAKLAALLVHDEFKAN